MRFYAVIDTNVVVSAMMSWTSPPARILDYAVDGTIVPLYNSEVIDEYREVLRREKFKFSRERTDFVINKLMRMGLYISPGDGFDSDSVSDPEDVPFYAVVMEKRKTDDAWLVTGNVRDFPQRPFIVTPREMLDIIESKKTKDFLKKE